MSIIATRLDEYRLAYDRSNLDAWEHKLSNFGALATYQKDTPVTIPGYQDLVTNRTAEVRTVSIPIIDRTTFTTAGTRTCDPLTHEMTSEYVTPSWTTLKTGFNMTPAEHENNYIKYMDLFMKKMKHMQLTFARALDTLAVASLEAGHTLIYGAAGNPYAEVGDELVVTAAQNELFLNELGSVMEADDFPSDDINIVSSTRFQALVREYSAQGTSNAENRVFQFGGQSFAYTNRLVPGGANRDEVFAMPPGSLAFLTWVDPDARLNHKSTDGKEWTVANLPILGFDVGLLYQSTCADKSSGSPGTGLEATLSESFHFSFDYSFNVAYNSDTATYAGPIHKFVLTLV